MYAMLRLTATQTPSEQSEYFPQGGTTGDRRKSWKIYNLPQLSLPEWRGLPTYTHLLTHGNLVYF